MQYSASGMLWAVGSVPSAVCPWVIHYAPLGTKAGMRLGKKVSVCLAEGQTVRNAQLSVRTHIWQR